MGIRRPGDGRTFDQHLRARLPGVVRALTARVISLPLRSRLRGVALKQAVRSSFDAYNRRDLDVVLSSYHPQVEIKLHHVGGIEGDRRGHEGWRHYWEEWFDSWDRSEQWATEVLDFGDRALVLGAIRAQAHASGMEMEQPWAMLVTFRDGLIVRHEEWFDQAAGLAAAGVVA